MDALVLPGFGSDLLPFLSFALAKWVVLYIHVGRFLLETGSSNTKEVDIPPPLPPSHIFPPPPLSAPHYWLGQFPIDMQAILGTAILTNQNGLVTLERTNELKTGKDLLSPLIHSLVCVSQLLRYTLSCLQTSQRTSTPPCLWNLSTDFSPVVLSSHSLKL